MTDTELIQAIRQRAISRRVECESKGLQLHPPATEATIRIAENRIGFKLPSFLRLVYMGVGNGGFGPGYGIVGLEGGFLDDGRDITGVYESLSEKDDSDPQWLWPAFQVPICTWGCAIYTCVDAFTDEGEVYTFDPNGHEIGEPIARLFARTHESIKSWFRDWANGVPLWDKMFVADSSQATTIINPFTGVKSQIAPTRMRDNSNH